MTDAPDYAELATATNFSFLRGASHARDLVVRAAALGHKGIGIADRNTVAGVVRAWTALRDLRADLKATHGLELDFKLIVGARLAFADGTPDIIAYPATRFGWGRLCRLLTRGNLRAEKGECILHFADLIEHIDDLLLILIPPDDLNRPPEEGWAPFPAKPKLRLVGTERKEESRPILAASLAYLNEAAPGRVWLAAAMHRRGADRRRLARLAKIADAARVPLIAVNDVLHAEPGDRPLQDVLTCIREKVTIHDAGLLLESNGERHLKDPAEMARLFRDAPRAITATTELLGRVIFDLKHLTYEYPHEPVPACWTPQGWLTHLTWRKAREVYPDGIPAKVRRLLHKELKLIGERNYACYFLTVYDIVKFAKSQEPPILCQGRGSAANSAVCYVLGITSVDPAKFDLLFSRFVSTERKEPPDIDVDFEHERREEVMQYIYRRYGRDRAGIAATVIHYRPRSAVREIGKALGLTEDVTTRLTSTVWGSYASGMDEQRFRETGFDPDNPEIARLNDLVGRLLQFPRHLSQHVGGFVLSEDRLDETVPIHNAAMPDRTFIEWDKDDIDALGLMKVDILALGMLSCIRKAFDLIAGCGGTRYGLETVPPERPQVYAMLQTGDSIGVFQVESRAQMNMLPRLKPEEFYDLVIQVAIVRPGPIEGDMVHPYLRRRQGLEEPDYPSPGPEYPQDELKQVLKKTLGVPLFQEQAMQLVIIAAEFSDADANRFRRAMATFRNVGTMPQFEKKMIDGMVRRGYDPDFARRCFEQIKGFGSYGFPESHALSFARLVYVSAYIKCFHPAAFAAALLNSQPMGFYAPAQIVRDARAHGVEVLGIDMNHSGWDNSLERDASGKIALRLGFRQIDGFRVEWADAMVAARGDGFASIEALARAAALPPRALNLLADADAIRSIGLDRRQALWEVRRTPGAELPLFAAASARELGEEADAVLPEMPLSEHVVADYQTARLSLKGHPMQFLRPIFAAERVMSCAEVGAAKDGRRVKVAGVVLVRQRPGKGNAIFVTLEDETGVTNILLWARDFERHRRAVMAARLMLVEGQVQKSPEGIVHLMASRVSDRTHELGRLSSAHMAPPRTGESAAARPSGHPRNVRILPGSRDFH
ncbi:error-prone DNA polymerase [Sphingomonas oleivorans]|uniref:Error-prone DNA polymerase n=1 Tax=Sphingomonas oleivorans TaxID=1735121 RepID=A0A2T5FV81_9SPHN|nr:error-prone DNA polymerase [Sphingomonas oleivorans]PTQ08627.1 error-prone DNA polymerase [Sphingomonas oleivorans]